MVWYSHLSKTSAVCHDPQTNRYLKTTEIYCPTVMETTSLKRRCQQGMALSETYREECFLAASSFWYWPVIFGIPWLITISCHSLPLS